MPYLKRGFDSLYPLTQTNNARPAKDQNKDSTVLRIAVAAFVSQYESIKDVGKLKHKRDCKAYL